MARSPGIRYSARMTPRPLLVLLSLALAGCVSTAVTVVKAPFAVGGKAVDLATTSPSERDRAYVRRQRKQEERQAKERRETAKRCRKSPDASECRSVIPAGQG